MNTKLDTDYWENRYIENTSKWDLGEVSPPIRSYIDMIENKELKILIPGGGNSYEAEYLYHQGFKNTWVIDLAPTPLANLLKRVPDFPPEQLIKGDFFNLNDSFDLIIEQTFFCALHPKLRENYVHKMHDLLHPNGKLAGLLFNVPLNIDKPPFGGSEEVYRSLFLPFFNIEEMSVTANSIASRKGRELFFQFVKKA
ncbi:methyltransferase domain-containing protein [Aquimarina addita]|uniref:Methyltransferase domain-containing protein n=1 Tax=Aquimarina addita TaxID=870485 RepID=A0ABP6UVF9_9FLAO